MIHFPAFSRISGAGIGHAPPSINNKTHASLGEGHDYTIYDDGRLFAAARVPRRAGLIAASFTPRPGRRRGMMACWPASRRGRYTPMGLPIFLRGHAFSPCGGVIAAGARRSLLLRFIGAAVSHGDARPSFSHFYFAAGVMTAEIYAGDYRLMSLHNIAA